MIVYGEVKDVRLATATNANGQQRLKGFGYVQFSTELGPQRAAAAARSGAMVFSELPSPFDSFRSFLFLHLELIEHLHS
jgi:hypothetical protein